MNREIMKVRFYIGLLSISLGFVNVAGIGLAFNIK
jgi:hypothetical protein